MIARGMPCPFGCFAGADSDGEGRFLLLKKPFVKGFPSIRESISEEKMVAFVVVRMRYFFLY